MGISEDIKQKEFKNEFTKAIINLMFTTSWLGEKYSKVFKPHGLTSAQFNVLRILRGQGSNPVTINLIIDRMLDRMSNASRIVDRLESKELVIRNQCKKDRRAVDVLISEKGMKLLEVIDRELESLENGIRNLTDQECVQLNRLLDKLRN